MATKIAQNMENQKVQFPFRQAVVIGGGIAGLTVARVLVDYVARVIIVERDQRADASGSRPGVPQRHHPHNLQPQAQRILEELFPGLTDELVKRRAVRMGGQGDVAFHYAGHWQVARSGPRHAILSCSRTLLEQVLYDRIHAHDRIEVMYGYEIDGLQAQDGRVSNVRLLPRPGTVGGERLLEAELVVDASGRRSRAPEWLATLGYPSPEEWHIDAQVGYASRLYERPADLEVEWKMLYIRPTPPEGTRGGIITPLEGDRWHVALVGVAGDYPPTKEDEFLAFAKSLPTDKLYEAIKDARPLSRIHGFRRADNRVRRYDCLPRLLEGFLVGGDAAYALNPLYAQGMTAAVLTAEALAEVLQNHPGRVTGDVRGLAHAFQAQVSEAVQGPWRLATRTDWAWANTEISDNGDTLLS